MGAIEKVSSRTITGSSHSAYISDDFPDGPVLRTIVRKIDYRIVPLMLLCYMLQFLDKVLINYANIMGLSTSVGMKGNDFSWMATAFFIGYAVGEFPQGYLIQKLPVTKVLGVNVCLWGVTICCSAGTQNFAGITAVRVLLGMFEAVITPALIMITGQWYTKRQGTFRTGLWYCGLGIGQSVGGIISFAAQHGSTTGNFEGWRIMFVATGVFNLLIGSITFFWMPRGIDEAKFLSEEEKTIVRTALAADQAGNGKKIFRVAGVWEALTDAQVWLLFLMTILIVIPSGIITTFSATLIRGFGYTSKQSALLNVPSGAVSIIATLLGSSAILYNFPRWLAICLLMIPTLVGAGLMSFYTKNQAGSLAGIYLINFDVAPLALVYALLGANTQGYTKKVTANIMIAIGFSIANIIGPQTFNVKDAPEYTPAKITVFGVCGGTVLISIAIRILYGIRNRATAAAREAIQDGNTHSVEGEDMTDKENPLFCYVY